MAALAPADTPDDHDSVTAGTAVHTQALTPVALDSVESAFPHASFDQPIGVQSFVEAQTSILHMSTNFAARAVLDSASSLLAQGPTELLQASSAPAHEQSAGVITLMNGVAVPSAQQLAGSADAGSAGGVPHDAVIAQVLIDALHGGGTQGPDIDALLSSLTGAYGGATSAIEPGIDHAAAFLDNWHGPAFGSAFGAAGSPHAAFTIDTMIVHQDAPPAA
jgi:hypothetical protein